MAATTHATRSRAWSATSVALCTVLALTGCSGQVDALAADPIASTTPAGGELVIDREDEAENGGLLGKPSPAKVLRAYAFESDAAARRAVGELLVAAEDAGWAISVVSPDRKGFSATRHVDGRRATLHVARNHDPAFPPAPGVFVSLSQRGN